ncbi:MAG: hypothetical protein M1833_005336 [Piccolia ochrophora]|nr:MAG: hypothetical protein M1833_005336 [Piccolia ochrophora]
MENDRAVPTPDGRERLESLDHSPLLAGVDPREAVAISETKPPRAFDVRTILNPLQSETPYERDRRRNAGHSETAADATSTLYASFNTRPRSPQPMSREHMITPPSGDSQSGHLSHAPRRILTPRSPSLRTLSLSRPSVGTIDAQQSPFLSSGGHRTYIAEPGLSKGSEVPPLPTSMVLSRFPSAPYGFPPRGHSPPPSSRRASMGTTQTAHSQSASPSTSYSSFSQPGQASPAPQHGLSATRPTPPSQSSAAGSLGPQQGGPGPSSFLPTSSSLAQSSYQLLTLDTAQGPIQVPVDVQAASKMADDKRKRNAGASARFRQRRKEKEREASQTISKLEQQIRDVTEEREFYRQERDHFRHLVAIKQGQAAVGQRPPSPRLHSPRESTHWHERSSLSPERNVRPRTNSYPTGPALALPGPPGPSPLPPTYTGQPQSVSRPHDTQGPSGSTGSATAPKTEPYDAYAPERFNRSWFPGPPPR